MTQMNLFTKWTMRFLGLLLGILLANPIFADLPRFETEIVLSPPHQGISIQTFERGSMGIERVKVTPQWGLPYYLVPAKGASFFDNSGASFKPVMHVGEWVLWEW
ncbi:MAG: DUF2782 domain-containing protein [Gammaproteobacteria bacterium]|nr:DUF2782 domain-containing protein [Gammaproteobacteria bacterium]